MTMGTGIVLFVIGAILTFAINVDVEWANLDVIGYILMAAGAIAFVVGLVMMVSRRGRADEGRVVEDDRI